MVLCMLEKSDQYGRWRSRVKSCGSATHLPYFQPVSLPPSACCCSDWSLVIVALASLYDEEGPVELAELQRCLLCFRRRRRLREDQSKEAEARSKEGGRDQGKFNLHHQVEKSRLGRGEFEFERGRESRRVVVLERSILLSEFSNRFVPFTFSSVLSSTLLSLLLPYIRNFERTKTLVSVYELSSNFLIRLQANSFNPLPVKLTFSPATIHKPSLSTASLLLKALSRSLSKTTSSVPCLLGS